MTVEFYIPKRQGTEKGFEHVFERNAAVDIANAFHQTYHDSDLHYALLFNLDRPPADLVVITNHGVGVVELKHISGTVRGTIDNQWTILQNGSMIPLEVSRKYINPFEQVRKYRFDLYQNMKTFARVADEPAMPDWMKQNGQFHLQAAVVLTDDCTIDLNLDPDRTKPWFEAIYQKKLPQWAYSLTFSAGSHREPLANEQIDALCEGLLGAETWHEIGTLVVGSDIYGYLSVYDTTGHSPTHNPLSEMIVTVGREPSNSIPIGATGISRHHARVVREGDGVYIEDLGSTNGTWLNAQRLEANTRHRLLDGDQLVFGPCADGKPKPNARRAQFSTRISTSPDTQVFMSI